MRGRVPAMPPGRHKLSPIPVTGKPSATVETFGIPGATLKQTLKKSEEPVGSCTNQQLLTSL
jgi:hypothetical protein